MVRHRDKVHTLWQRRGCCATSVRQRQSQRLLQLRILLRLVGGIHCVGAGASAPRICCTVRLPPLGCCSMRRAVLQHALARSGAGQHCKQADSRACMRLYCVIFVITDNDFDFQQC